MKRGIYDLGGEPQNLTPVPCESTRDKAAPLEPKERNYAHCNCAWQRTHGCARRAQSDRHAARGRALSPQDCARLLSGGERQHESGVARATQRARDRQRELALAGESFARGAVRQGDDDLRVGECRRRRVRVAGPADQRRQTREKRGHARPGRGWIARDQVTFRFDLPRRAGGARRGGGACGRGHRPTRRVERPGRVRGKPLPGPARLGGARDLERCAFQRVAFARVGRAVLLAALCGCAAARLHPEWRERPCRERGREQRVDTVLDAGRYDQSRRSSPRSGEVAPAPPESRGSILNANRGGNPCTKQVRRVLRTAARAARRRAHAQRAYAAVRPDGYR